MPIIYICIIQPPSYVFWHAIIGICIASSCPVEDERQFWWMEDLNLSYSDTGNASAVIHWMHKKNVSCLVDTMIDIVVYLCKMRYPYVVYNIVILILCRLWYNFPDEDFLNNICWNALDPATWRQLFVLVVIVPCSKLYHFQSFSNMQCDFKILCIVYNMLKYN